MNIERVLTGDDVGSYFVFDTDEAGVSEVGLESLGSAISLFVLVYIRVVDRLLQPR